MPSYKDIHPGFRFNGYAYSREGLRGIGYDLIKEGDSHEMSLGDFILDWLSDRPYLTVQTSGSTGTPKEITLAKERMVASALATGEYLDLQPGELAFHCLPANFIAGKMMFIRALVLGLELYYTAPSNSPLKGGRTRKYSFSAMVPSQVMNSLEELDRVGTLIIGGASVSRELQKALSAKRIQAFESFGMTETISHIALRRLNPSNGDPGPFQTLPGITVGTDERGCLTITAPALLDNSITTNDLVELHSDTEFTWLGRADHVINSGGVKVIPEQVEAALADYLEQPLMVAGLPHPELGEEVVLFIEGEGNGLSIEDLRAKGVGLGKYQWPKRIIQLPHFNYTENGKLDRRSTLKKIK